MPHLLGRLLLPAFLVIAAGISTSSLGEGTESINKLDADQLVRQLSDRCGVWLMQPRPDLKSLKYTFHLGGNERVVELSPAVRPTRRSMWQGATLCTGLHALAASPQSFQATVERIEDDATYREPFIRLTVRPRASDGSFRLEVGNGIEGSWHGYYTHTSAEMRIDLDPKTLLPMRELHRDSQYAFSDWQEVKPNAWIPRLAIATHDGAEYRMHFAWQGAAVWLLTQAEIASGNHARTVARVTDVLVNNEGVAMALTANEQRLDAARKTVRAMLDRNAAWLAPTPSSASLQYTFHTEPQDVTESCVVRQDGLTAFEVIADGKGKMAEQMGSRKIVTSGNRYATTHRGDAFAKARQVTPDRNEPSHARQLRRYALQGCQFDLPLFELRRVLNQATIEIKDGQWNGTPCHVATITAPGRWGYLGCGVMLGFTSWSYVHHLYPECEVIYIDKQRLVPLHETLVAGPDDRRFEIEFGDYRKVDAAGKQLVPIRIEITAKDYFTCRYEFQLASDHWLLRTVESWFDPSDKSRGDVANVEIDQPSNLAEAANQQIAAYRELFEANDSAKAASATTSLNTLPFHLGQPISIGPTNVVFTLDDKVRLVVRCTAPADKVEVGQSATVLLLDDNDRLIQAGYAAFHREEDRLRAEATFGSSYALRNVSRFAIVGLGDVSNLPGGESRQLRIVPVTQLANPLRTPGIADDSGKTQMVDVTLRRNEANQSLLAVHFVSSDGPQEFELDASAAFFDKSQRLIAAASKSGILKVQDDIREDTWELTLPSSLDINEISTVAAGVSRGHTLSVPFSATWTTYLDLPGPFSLKDCLAAADRNCWPEAFNQLDRQLEDSLHHGLLDDWHDWHQQQDEQRLNIEHETLADRLRPHVPRLVELTSLAQEPAMLARAIRLLGFSADPRAIQPACKLLRSDDSTVSDAAAIALGLLGSDEGLERIDQLIGRPEPARNDPAWRDRYSARRDALIALATIRSDSSIPAAEKWMMKFVDGSEVVINVRGGSQLSGSAYLLEQFAQLLGRLPHPKYLPILTAALIRAEQRDLAIVPAREELLQSIISYGAAARSFIEPRVRRGEAATVYAVEDSHDDSYAHAMATMLETSTNSDDWQPAINYLWNLDSQEALHILQKTFERDVSAGKHQEATRLHLAKALAARGDDRGLPAAMSVLIDVAKRGTPPEDEEARHKWQKQIDDRREDALDVFQRANTNDVARLLNERAQHADDATRLAILQVLQQMHTIPATIQPLIEEWARDKSSSEVSHLAERLLVRQR